VHGTNRGPTPVLQLPSVAEYPHVEDDRYERITTRQSVKYQQLCTGPKVPGLIFRRQDDQFILSTKQIHECDASSALGCRACYARGLDSTGSALRRCPIPTDRHWRWR